MKWDLHLLPKPQKRRKIGKKSQVKKNSDEDWIPKDEEIIDKKPKLDINKARNSKELKRLRLNPIEKRINQDYRIIRQQYGDIIR